MKMPTIKELKDLRDKKILMRVDFNVPVIKGKIEDDFRIKKTLPTIKFLKKKGAQIILISHLTEGKTKSLRPMANYLKIKFIKDIDLDVIKRKTQEMKDGEVVLIENIRNFKGEEENDKNFSKKLASLADIYINEAFSVSHRNHASIVGLPRYLPSYAGFLFEEEIKNLSTAFNPKHPFLLILGGIKFKTKLGVLEKFLKTADKIFIGGALANNFFKLYGKDIGDSIIDESVDVSKYLDEKKIILPIDVVFSKNKILDAGLKTMEMLSEIIKKSKFILWNGPLGDYENGFKRGTIELARVISSSNAISIIGGGDTVAAVKKVGLKNFSFVSTGGGAMLEFLSNGTLPGIEALKIK